MTAAPVLQQILDGGQCRHDALVAGDGAGVLVLGHVEVAAQQDLLALATSTSMTVFLL